MRTEVSANLGSEGIKIIRQPPNPSELALCDFWLFDLIKQKLTDESSSQSLHRAVNKIMNSTNKNDYKKTLDNRLE